MFVLSFILVPVVVFADTIVDVTLTVAGDVTVAVTAGPNRDNNRTYYIAPYSLSINGAAPVNGFSIDFLHESQIPQNWTEVAIAYLWSIYENHSDFNTRKYIQHAMGDLFSGQLEFSTPSMQYLETNALSSLNMGSDDYNTIRTFGWVNLTDPPQDPVATPEPGTIILLGSGLVGLAGFARRKFKK